VDGTLAVRLKLVPSGMVARIAISLSNGSSEGDQTMPYLQLDVPNHLGSTPLS
jgi:hypothetical protein